MCALPFFGGNNNTPDTSSPPVDASQQLTIGNVISALAVASSCFDKYDKVRAMPCPDFLHTLACAAAGPYPSHH